MPVLRTMHDVRTLRTVASRAVPEQEGAIFLQLHRFSTEKLRLERELELWQRKTERIESRLVEIEQQMDRLRLSCPTVTSKAVAPAEPMSRWREIVVEY